MRDVLIQRSAGLPSVSKASHIKRPLADARDGSLFCLLCRANARHPHEEGMETHC